MSRGPFCIKFIGALSIKEIQQTGRGCA